MKEDGRTGREGKKKGQGQPKQCSNMPLIDGLYGPFLQ